MAVYTALGAERLAELIAAYDVGDLVSAKGIAEGISNSNWLVETTGREGTPQRFVLTMYEKRIAIRDLPFFLGLMDHLAHRGCPVPATIHDREGNASRMVEGKAVALIEYLPGLSPTLPSPGQAFATGAALAEMHRAARGFAHRRANRLTPANSLAILERLGSRLSEIAADLPATLVPAASAVVAAWPTGLPRGIVHSDLFPDNVLMRGETVTGMIDFYFACEDFHAYDLAVTHAAWCFADGGAYLPANGAALVAGYESRRALDPAERLALPVLAQGACLRFLASRAEDWFNTPDGAQVRRKDPLEYAAKLAFYRESGEDAFA